MRPGSGDDVAIDRQKSCRISTTTGRDRFTTRPSISPDSDPFSGRTSSRLARRFVGSTLPENSSPDRDPRGGPGGDDRIAGTEARDRSQQRFVCFRFSSHAWRNRWDIPRVRYSFVRNKRRRSSLIQQGWWYSLRGIFRNAGWPTIFYMKRNWNIRFENLNKPWNRHKRIYSLPLNDKKRGGKLSPPWFDAHKIRNSCCLILKLIFVTH